MPRCKCDLNLGWTALECPSHKPIRDHNWVHVCDNCGWGYDRLLPTPPMVCFCMTEAEDKFLQNRDTGDEIDEQ